MNEGRAHPRFQEKGIVNIKVVSAPGAEGMRGATFFSLCGDVSSGGLSFSSHTAPAVGTILELRVAFTAPSQVVKSLAGRVAWTRKIPHGDRFMVGVDLSRSDPVCLSKWKSVIGKRIHLK